MKNLCRLAIIAIAAMLTGCGVTGFNAANVEGTQTQVKIAEGNFRVIKNVEGFSSATYILGIGGLSKEATRENAVADMFEKTHLTGSQTIANIHTKQHIASFLGLYIRVSYYAYGQVIEFNRSTAVNSPSANIASTASKTSSYKYKVGDYYDDGMKEGVIFEVSDDGMHGKILQYAGKSQWSNMKQTNGCYEAENGILNTNQILNIGDRWQSTYPAFAACKELGDSWYLPAIDELQTIISNRKLLNVTLQANDEPIISDNYWSSTEINETQAVAIYEKDSINDAKSIVRRILAVPKF